MVVLIVVVIIMIIPLQYVCTKGTIMVVVGIEIQIQLVSSNYNFGPGFLINTSNP